MVKHGSWAVIGDAPKRASSNHRMVRCRCDCGTESELRLSVLRNGRSSSCRKCASVKHGESRNAKQRGSDEWVVWMSMRQRCRDPKSKSFAGYGGRGIRVCQRWESYEAFLADMGRRPKGATLERIDNDGDYGPENCRWATLVEQANNKRNSRTVTALGRTRTLAQWSRATGVSASLIRARLENGWPPNAAVSEPPSKHRNAGRPRGASGP